MSAQRERLVACVVTVLLLATFNLAGSAPAGQDAGTASVSSSDLQRSQQMDRYTELADRGPGRGESIYFYKCFYCHNQYAKGGPALTGLFRRALLASGNPVDDQTVMSVIRDDGTAMPGFGHTLDDTDMADLLAYLKSPQCCYDADRPPVNPQYLAAVRPWPVPNTVRGGVHGQVRNTSQEPLPGIKVQLIAPNGVRTTVSTDEAGHYEFPAMQAGDYLLRVATPLLYRHFHRSGVRIAGRNAIDDIVLERVPLGADGALPGALPATDEIAAQLSGSELLWSLPGSIQEKTAFIRTCGIGCHDLKEILRNRFDERGWRTIVGWMTSRGSSSVFVVRPPPAFTPDAERVIKWLSRVRGPGSTDESYRSFPRPAQASANVVITEYELPRKFLSMHDIAGDSRGNIWITSHRSLIVGRLDPRTGIVQEYQVPGVPGMFPGTHKVAVDRKDVVWFSQNWAHRVTRLDPATGQFKQLLIEMSAPFNAGGWGNFALAPDGSLWSEHDNNTIAKIDTDTGRILARYPLAKNPNPSDNLVSRDGRFWAGSSPTMGGNTGMILDIASGRMYEANSGDFPSSAARGGFDRNNNAWFGGHTGTLVEIANEIDQGKGIRIRSFTPPTPYFPYTQLYSAMPDRNGDVWSAWVHGRGFVRFNPASGSWRVYDSAEPSAFTRSTWVDNSTTPVSVWYADYQLGMLVRMQPRD